MSRTAGTPRAVGVSFLTPTPTPFKNQSHWGYRSHSTYSWNNMDTETMAQDFTEDLGLETRISDSRYSPLLTTIGPDFRIDASNKISINLYAWGGIVFTDTRAFTITVFDDMGDEVLKEVVNFDNNVAFGYNFGLDLQFNLIEDFVFLSLYTDYTGMNQKSTVSFDAENFEGLTKMRFLNYGFKITVIPPNK